MVFFANNFSKIKLRVNIYSLKSNFPDKQLLNMDLYVDVVDSKTGWSKVHLEHTIKEGENPKIFFPEQCHPVMPVIFELQARINGRKQKRIFATLLLWCTNEADIDFSNGEGSCSLYFAGFTNDLLRTGVFNVSKK